MLNALISSCSDASRNRSLMRSFDAVSRVLCMLVLGAFPTVGHAYAQHEFPEADRYFGSVGVDWDEAQAMVVDGVPLRITTFGSPRPALEVASLFSSGNTVFQRVLTMPGQLILSGLKDSWHWIAVLRDEGSGTRGYVSAMSSKVAAPEFPAWLQSADHTFFSISNTASDQASVQYVHQVSGSLENVQARIEGRLESMGWKRHSDPGRVGRNSQWSKDTEQLSIMLLPYAGGTLVSTQQQQRVRP